MARGPAGRGPRQVVTQSVPLLDGYYRATFVLNVAAADPALTILVHIALEEAQTGRLFHTGPDLALPIM